MREVVNEIVCTNAIAPPSVRCGPACHCARLIAGRSTRPTQARFRTGRSLRRAAHARHPPEGMAMGERRRREWGQREHRGFSLALAAAPDLGAGGLPRSSGQQTVPPGQPGGGIVTSPPSTSGMGSNGSGSGSNGSGSKFTTDDMKTYGYSFSDEAAITADLTLVTATLQQFGADAASHDVSAA